MIVKIIFGSQLYGTATAQSDKDFKGVGLPTWHQIALGKIPKHIEMHSTGDPKGKNSAEDVDTEIFSLHEFIKLALEGQTVAIDMLHAPEACLIQRSHIWDRIVANRHRFYSKNIHSFLGYAIGQAAKYGIKGSRLNNAKTMLQWLESLPPAARLGEYSEDAPSGEHITCSEDHIEVCGKKLQHTCKIDYLINIIRQFVDSYGARARMAANNEGIDWKAVSHALRAAYQMRELFSEGTVTFPRPEAAFLTRVKTGQLDYSHVGQVLEGLIDEVKGLREQCTLPDQPDHEYWEDFLIGIVSDISRGVRLD